MATLALVYIKGLKKDMYEKLRKEVDWEHKQPGGLLFHSAAFDDDGDIHVADLWESPRHMDEFFQARLIPVMEKAGFPTPEGVEIYEVHNVNAFDGLKKHMLGKKG